jgi:hypothetical protein
MTIEKLFDVSVEITAKEKALDLESFVDQVIKPASYRLAEKCDTYVGTKILEGAGLYVSNDLFATPGDMALAKKAANHQQLEPGSRFCLMNEDLEADLLGQTWFNTHQNRGDTGVSILNEGNLGRTMGMDFFSSLQFPSNVHTAGDGVTTTDNGTASAGIFPNNKIGVTTLTVDSFDGSATPILAGDRIQISGVRRPLIVAADVDQASSTAITLVDPITEIIPDGAAVTVIGSGQSNISTIGAIFDSQSLAVAMPVLDKPSDKPSFVVSNNGFSIRVVTGYDMIKKKETMSLDLLIGAKAYDPRRITLLGEY